jgi:hypothetical protein
MSNGLNTVGAIHLARPETHGDVRLSFVMACRRSLKAAARFAFLILTGPF